jgi:hypothetical protein
VQAREQFVVPVELTTGKRHQSHDAQTILYSLLLAERCGKRWGFAEREEVDRWT